MPLLEMNLLLALLLALWPLFRRRLYPGGRYAIAVVVLIGLMFPLRPALPTRRVQVALPSLPVAAEATRPGPESTPIPLPLSTAIGEMSAADAEHPPRVEGQISSPLTGAQWRRVLLIFYLAGVGAVLLLHLARHASERRWIRLAALPVADEAMLRRIEAERNRMGLRRAVRAMSLPDIHTPFVVGALRPVLVLPEEPELSDMVLRHELYHIKRHDLLIRWIALFVRALHWYNPLTYALIRITHWECELSCDAYALRGVDEDARFRYAEELLTVALDRGPRRALTTEWNGGKCQMKKRMMQIIDTGRRSRGLVITALVAAAVLLAGQVLSLGEALSPREAHNAHTGGFNDPEFLIYGEGRGYAPVVTFADLPFLDVQHETNAGGEYTSFKTHPFSWRLSQDHAKYLKPGYEVRALHVYHEYEDADGEPCGVETVFAYVQDTRGDQYLPEDEERALLTPRVDAALKQSVDERGYCDLDAVIDLVSSALGEAYRPLDTYNYCASVLNEAEENTRAVYGGVPVDVISSDLSTQKELIEQQREVYREMRDGSAFIDDPRALTWENAPTLIDELIMEYGGRDVFITFANDAAWSIYPGAQLDSLRYELPDGRKFFLHIHCDFVGFTGLTPDQAYDEVNAVFKATCKEYPDDPDALKRALMDALTQSFDLEDKDPGRLSFYTRVV